ncbi:hypothetical protein SH668x_000999 [Planctomicrobium sp. SH668]|uniref:hypothetical protein n=1 Tax=Planctomicrobium sp. SH668 TaxID=3448126 RepID=UPI003F5BC6DF
MVMNEEIARIFSQESRKSQRWLPVLRAVAESCVDFWDAGASLQESNVRLLNEITREAIQSRRVLDSHDVSQALASAADRPVRLNGRMNVSYHHAAMDLAISWPYLLWNRIGFISRPYQSYDESGDVNWLRQYPPEVVKQANSDLLGDFNLSEVADEARIGIERERAKILEPLGTPFESSEIPAIRLFERKPLKNSKDLFSKCTNPTEISLVRAALEFGPLKGEALCQKVRLEFNSNTKNALSSLRKRGILANCRRLGGYYVPSQSQDRKVKSQD